MYNREENYVGVQPRRNSIDRHVNRSRACLDDLAIPGLSYDILEADSRVGGRIYTHHFSGEKHDYYDVGAMRFPRIPGIMDRTFQLFERTGVTLNKYYLDGVNTPQYFNQRFFVKGEFDPYHVSEQNGGSVKRTRWDQPAATPGSPSFRPAT